MLFLAIYGSIGCMEMKRINSNILPQPPLRFVDDLMKLAPEASTSEHIEATLSYLEAKQKAWTTEQDRRLMRAEKRIRLCSYLNSHWAAFVGRSGQKSHFNWCPFEEWMGSDFMAVYDLPHRDHGHE